MTLLEKGPASVSATEGRTRKSDQLDGSITSETNIAVTLPQAALISRIKAHIAKGDKAAEKAEQHYIAAGQHLKTLKAEHAGSWAEWEELLKTKIGIGKSRATELMQIADGTKPVDQVRAGTAQRMKQLRSRSPSRDGENAEASVETAGAAESAATAGAADDADGKARKQPARKPTKKKIAASPAKPKRSTSQDQRELEAKQAHIDELEATREHDQGLAEKLRAAEIKIVGLESEVEELKAENAKLREQLEAAQKVAA